MFNFVPEFKKNRHMDLNEKQIQILEVAEKLFAENTFDGTSVRQIATVAKVNVAMISYYFGSKEKLLENLFLYRSADFRLHVESVLLKDISYFEKIDTIIDLTIKRIHKNRRTHKIVHFEYSNKGRQINLSSYEAQKKDNLKVLEKFIKEGQKAGVFNKNINIQLLVPTILGTYFHFYYNQRFYKTLLQLDDEKAMDDYVHNTLTKHIKQTINVLLTHES